MHILCIEERTINMAKREFNRKEYEKVRRMDHNTMKEYIEEKYQRGYKDGQEQAAKGIEEALNKIRALSGIGPKKMEQIMQCMEMVGGDSK